MHAYPNAAMLELLISNGIVLLTVQIYKGGFQALAMQGIFAG